MYLTQIAFNFWNSFYVPNYFKLIFIKVIFAEDIFACIAGRKNPPVS